MFSCFKQSCFALSSLQVLVFGNIDPCFVVDTTTMALLEKNTNLKRLEFKCHNAMSLRPPSLVKLAASLHVNNTREELILIVLPFNKLNLGANAFAEMLKFNHSLIKLVYIYNVIHPSLFKVLLFLLRLSMLTQL